MTTPFVFETTCDSAIVTGLIGLTGAIIGAAISGVVTYGAAVRREKADRAEEKRKTDMEVKRAARLIHADLLSGMALIGATMNQGAFNLPPLSTESWKTYSHILAPELSDDEWFKVFNAANAMEHLILTGKTAIDSNLAHLPLGSASDSLKPLLDEIKDGLFALKKWHKDKPNPK